jgi:hypothetical protein
MSTRNVWLRSTMPGGFPAFVFVDFLGRRWRVHHCGHPTAHRPFSVWRPDGEPVPGPTGNAWERSSAARAEVERLARADVLRLIDEAAARVARECA